MSRKAEIIDFYETANVEVKVITGQRSKTKTKSKALYSDSLGKDVTIEELVLNNYLSKGYKGFWSENDYWSQIMTLLYWDEIYIRLEGVCSPHLESFPSEMEDMPRDMFHNEFFTRRFKIIKKRHKYLSKPSLFGLRAPPLERELRASWKKNKGKPCRFLDSKYYGDRHDYSLDELALSTKLLTTSQLIKIMERLISDYNNYRSGLPDLFLFKEGKPLFIEVKSKHEKIAEHQTAWHKYLSEVVGVEVVICRVIDKE